MQALPIRQFLLTNLLRPKTGDHMQFRIPIETLGASLHLLGDFPYKNPEEARYDSATLFIRGIRSQYVPDDVLPTIGRFFPRFEVKDVDCGHWVISERPDAFRQGKSSWPLIEYYIEPAQLSSSSLGVMIHPKIHSHIDANGPVGSLQRVATKPSCSKGIPRLPFSLRCGTWA